VDWWKRVLAIKPDEPLVHDNLGISLSMTGQQNEAVSHFRKSQELGLLKSLEFDPQNAQIHDKLGVLLLDIGRLEEALTHFRQAILLQPQLSMAHFHLGKALAVTGQIDEALQQLQKELNLNPQYAPALLQMGIIFAQRGEDEKAIQNWREALTEDPALSEAHYYWGIVLFKQGKPVEALAHWQESLQLRPKNQNLLRQMAWVLSTSPIAEIRNGQEALQLASQANLLSKGTDPAILDTMAAAYAEAGRFREALGAARSALNLINDDGQQSASIKSRIKLFETAQPYRDNSLDFLR
jgi:tetratricopeptide (TPR) repeat protein